MPYEAELSPRAAERLKSLEPSLRAAVVDNLLRLCESPTAASRPAPSPPYTPGFQMLEFSVRRPEGLHWFVFLFKYGADEQTLHIHGLSHRPPEEAL